MQKKNFVLAIDISIVLYFLFLRLGKITEFLIQPKITADEWIKIYPSVQIGPVIIQQGFSTLIIVLLALFTFKIGTHAIKKAQDDFVWFIGLNFVFWGISAFLTGLSDQAFGYYFNCSVGPFCSLTNYLQVLAKLLSVFSFNAILLAYTHILNDEKINQRLNYFAYTSILAYTVFQGIGLIYQNSFLVSFEGMLLFLSPNLLLFLYFSYAHRKQAIHQRLLKLWKALAVILGIYVLAVWIGLGTLLTQNFKLWLSEKDLLHLALLIWLIYFRKEILISQN